MKHRRRLSSIALCAALVCAALCCVPPALADGEVVATSGGAAGVTASATLEVSTLRVLEAENGDVRLPMASTTKVMTALVALENGDLAATYEIPAACVGVEGSSLYLKQGEKLTLEQLLYGLMLRSGNDAAEAIATFVGGSVENFVQMMNDKAAQLGAKNTHFVNPHGLTAEGHYTTACDLALIAAHAMRDPRFQTIVATQYKEIPGPEGTVRMLKNKNKLLWTLEGGNGVKTGYTVAAGKCLVAAAQREGMQVVSVALNSGSIFEQCARLVDAAFAEYSLVEVLAAGQYLGDIPVVNSLTPSVSVYMGESRSLALTAQEAMALRREVVLADALVAPVTAGQEVGVARVYVGEDLVCEQPIAAQQDVLPRTLLDYLRDIVVGW